MSEIYHSTTHQVGHVIKLYDTYVIIKYLCHTVNYYTVYMTCYHDKFIKKRFCQHVIKQYKQPAILYFWFDTNVDFKQHLHFLF